LRSRDGKMLAVALVNDVMSKHSKASKRSELRSVDELGYAFLWKAHEMTATATSADVTVDGV